MTDSRPPNDPAWEKLLNFALVDDEELTDAEVRERLTEANIDAAPAVKRVLQAVRRARARAALAHAGARRTRLLDRFEEALREGVDTARERLTEFVQRRAPTGSQAAYFRKLQGAASEEDLRELARDLLLLELMGDAQESDGSEG